MRGTPQVFNDYSYGVDKNLGTYSFDSNFARDLLNVRFNPEGKLVKRNGFATVASPTLPVTSLGTYERGTDKYLVAVAELNPPGTTDIYSVTAAGTVTSRKGSATVSAGRTWEIIQAPVNGSEGPVYMLNGSDIPLQWTGSGNVGTWTASSGSIPNGKYMVYHDNALFIAGVETNVTTKSTLYRSSLANPRLFETPDGVTTLFDPDDGEDITALGVTGPYPAIFKATKMFVVTNTETLDYRRVSDNKGCVSHRSVVSSDTGTFFLAANRTVCVTDGSSINPISTPVDPILALISDTMLPKASAIFFGDSYLLSCSVGGTENDTILEYNTNNSSWWVHKIYYGSSTTSGVTDWATIDPTGNAILYGAGANTSTRRIFQAFKSGVYSDLTLQAYTSYWDTSWNVYDNPHLQKVIQQIRYDSKGTDTLYLDSDFDNSFVSQTATTLQTTQTTEKAIYTPGTMRAISLRFENSDTSNWELFSHLVAIDLRTD